METIKIRNMVADKPNSVGNIFPKSVIMAAIKKCKKKISDRKLLMYSSQDRGLNMYKRHPVGVVHDISLNDDGTIECKCDHHLDDVSDLDAVIVAHIDACMSDGRLYHKAFDLEFCHFNVRFNSGSVC